MITNMNFEHWLDELIGTDTRATAARKTDYSQSTITRQLSRGHLRPETVISLCRAYDRSPIQGLIETGYIFEHEVDGPAVSAALAQATNQQILDEILRRSDPEARYLFGDDGSDDVVGLSEHQLRVVADSSPDEGEGLPDDYLP